MFTPQRGVRTGAVSIAALAAAQAWAGVAGAAEAAPADNKPAEVGELIVTAQKRAQLLTEVPAAVSAVSGERLEAQRVQSLQQLDNKVPSFRFTRFNLSDAHLNIRGIGSSPDGAAVERSVAIFIDDVYIGRAAAAASDIFDLERVEVLRGPQGTLYGKNVVGGAINYVTPTPNDTFRARIRAGFGNLGEYEAAGVINGPVADHLAASASASVRSRDGFATNLETGNKVEAYTAYTSRASLAYTGEAFRLRLSGDFELSKGNGEAWFPNATGVGAAGITPALMTGITPRAMYLGPDGYQRVQTGGLSAKADWDVGPGKLTSVTAYRQSNSDISISLVGSNVPRKPNGDVNPPQPFAQLNVIDENANQVSEEVRYLQESKHWTFLVGGFAMREGVHRYERTDTITVGSAARINVNDGRTVSLAAFADLTFRPTDKWEIDAGIRYTNDNRKFRLFHDGTGSQYGQFPKPGPFIANQDGTWDAVTPKFSVLYHITPSVNAYALVSRGFKSGGFDGQPNGIPGLDPINPEYVWNYEAGVKGTAFDSRAYFELTAFRMDYRDLQATTTRILSTSPLTTSTVLQNAAAAYINGVEGTGQIHLLPGLDARANFSHLDTRVTESRTTTTIAVGNELGNAPHWSYSVGLDYTVDLTPDYKFGASVDYGYVGRMFSTVENVPQGVKAPYGLLDARLRLTTSHGLEFTLWGANLTDKLYTVYQAAQSSVGGLANYGPPRTFGVTVGYSW